MEYRYKRIVVGKNDEGKSAVLSTTATNVQERPGMFYRATLWKTNEVPVDNSIGGDRAGTEENREPPYGGMHIRVLELAPERKDLDSLREEMRGIHNQYKQTHMPTEEDLARHPMMHRTDTLDIIFVFKGEIYLITDVEEILCKAGDCILIKGTNHAWSNRSTEPCMCMGVMLSALPLA